jgi:hypothetical protein
MIQLREYQEEISTKAVEVLQKLKIVYLAMQVRTGKTLTSLAAAQKYNAKKVLFLTKKKAIQSIVSDYESLKTNFELIVINNESLHLIKDNDFDLIISDEHHRNGAFPKPNKITKLIKERFSNKPMIFLSGTPTPESYSQWYHQFWISNFTPFKEYVNFYKWSNDYVNIKLKYLGYHQVKDYSDAYKDRIDKVINKYIISFTQEQSGFNSKVNENIIKVKMQDITYNITKELKKNNIFEGKNDVIIADTGVKLMSKLHQLYSGTCILESGKSIILDKSKCIEIEKKFKKNKIAIFYKFQAEYDLIKQYFNDKITNDLKEFNTTDKWIALQIVSGREGISLKEADYLVYFNIDYSAVSYWQSRDRLTTIDRKENNIFWIFSDGGIEQHIYNAVMNKKNYTLSVFKKNYNGINIPNKNN